jgi:hypothetical protein
MQLLPRAPGHGFSPQFTGFMCRPLQRRRHTAIAEPVVAELPLCHFISHRICEAIPGPRQPLESTVNERR